MEILLNILLLLVGFLSVIPVIQLFKTSKDMKYRCLKFLVNATFAWTFLIFVERFVMNNQIVYYAHLLGYPLKFLMAAFMLCTIFSYIETKMPKWLIYVLGFVFIAEYLVSITNIQTQYILKLVPSQMIGFESLYEADNGSLFFVHLALTYLVLLVSIVFLTLFLRKNKNIRQYKSVSKTMTYSVIIVLAFNAIQIAFLDTSIDLTYISLVITTFMLYQVIYKKDMIFNLKTSGRGEILSNMREMYILTDFDKRIVELSSLLEEKYSINSKDYEGKPFSTLIEHLKEQIIIYEDYDIEDVGNEQKDHLHIREKQFTLQKMNEFGYMYLLYDETQVFNLLRELNKLSNYDNMTGLHNRNFIENKLSQIKSTKNIGILSLDLNGLKANNDYLGHERGDFLLKQLANKMKIQLEEYEQHQMARIGGDEFIILMENTSIDTLNTIRKNILEDCENEDIEQKISVSIGIAFSNEGDEDIFDLIQLADKDMYSMKKETSKEYSKQIVLYATNKENYIR